MKEMPVVLLVALAFGGALEAKPGLSDYAGIYAKNGSMKLATAGTTLSGKVPRLKFSVKKNGRGGSLVCQGSISVPPIVDVSNVFRFSGKSMTIDKVAPAVEDTSVTGTFKVRRNGIRGQALYPLNPDVLATLEVKVTRKGKKQAVLTVTEKILISGVENYRYVYQASRRLKKNEL